MIGGRVTTRPVEVPEGPASLRDLDLGAGATSAPKVLGPAVIVPPPPGPAYGVQLASYRDRAAAEATASRLAGAGGGPLRVLAVDLGPRGVWYRVLVVGFVDADSAQAHRERLRAQGREPGPVLIIEQGR
jgi:cell division protein FtsN